MFTFQLIEAKEKKQFIASKEMCQVVPMTKDDDVSCVTKHKGPFNYYVIHRGGRGGYVKI